MIKGLAWKSLIVAALSYLLLLAAYLNLLPFAHGLISNLDTWSLQIKFGSRGMQAAHDKLRVVGITENTISAFQDMELYYPLPRDIHALALKRLADAGARVVVFDVLFSEAGSWDEEEDAALRDAVVYARDQGCDVVLAMAIEESIVAKGVRSSSLILPAPTIMEAQPALGLSNTLEKLSFKVVELEAIDFPSSASDLPDEFYTQAVEAYRLICGQDGKKPDNVLNRAMVRSKSSEAAVSGFFRINYFSPSAEYPGHLYSYEMLFPGLFDEEMRALTDLEQAQLANQFGDCVVFVGSRARLDNDYFNTPFGEMFGVETNAQAFDTLFRERIITAIPPVGSVMIAAVLALLAWFCSLLRPILRSAVIAVLTFILIFAADLYIFSLLRLELSLTMVSAGFLFPFITCSIYNGVMEELAKAKIRATFSRYVSKQVVDQIIADPSLADLGGAERDVAMMFSDIRNYSTITEHLSPQQIVEFLNIYLGEMTEIIRRHNGFVDKYMGDGIMACFGGPVPTENPARDAINAALEMSRKLHEKIVPILEEYGLPRFKAGTGIHLGKVVMGNIGSQFRMDYTVIGDAVNVASRVEGQTKEYGWSVIVTRETLEAAGDGFDAEFLDERLVKGRAQPVAIYRIVDKSAPELYKL